MTTQKPVFYITRQVDFESAHRVYREDLDEKENKKLFGKCANAFGHGHHYVLEATFKGCKNPTLQMVVHLDQLKGLLKECIVEPLDHQHLNHGVEFLRGVVPTLENLVEIFWTRLESTLRSQESSLDFSLHKLKLSSSPRHWVEYYGGANAY